MSVIVSDTANTEYGTALTAGEAVEMRRRFQLAVELNAVVDFMATEPASYGGLYTDQEAGGEVVVSLVGSGGRVEEIKSGVRALLPPDVSLRFRSVQRTHDELRALQTRVDDDFALLYAEDIDANLTAVDVPNNAVILGVNGLTDAERERIVAAYGSAVTPVESAGGSPGACTRTNCSGERLRGGLALWNQYGGTCTSGFVAREANTITTTPYLITAGHCANPLSSYAEQFHPSSTLIGTVSRKDYSDGGSGDSAAFRISASRVSNYVWRYSDVTTYPITGAEVPLTRTLATQC